MPTNDVNLGGLPLIRQGPWFPGQMGVPGSDTRQGLRTHPTAVVLYVDPNHADASDAHDGTDPDHPLATVANAITKCAPYRGDVILVGANSGWQFANPASGYTVSIAEEVTLNVPGVRLVGSNHGALGVVWEPVAAAGAGTCIAVTVMDCTIEGFAFQGGLLGGRAIFLDWNGVTAWGENACVRHCTFDDDIDIGVEMEFSWYNEIAHCLFQECDAAGVYLDPAGSGAAYCAIHDNVFQDCLAALAVNGLDRSVIARNVIYNGLAQGAGAATNAGIDTTAGLQNTVAENVFSCLLPVPANGDWDDLNTAGASDAWMGNHVMNGLAITNPT